MMAVRRVPGESRHYEMKPLIRYNVFQMNTRVDGSRIKDSSACDAVSIFQKSADIIYQWIDREIWRPV